MRAEFCLCGSDHFQLKGGIGQAAKGEPSCGQNWDNDPRSQGRVVEVLQGLRWVKISCSKSYEIEMISWILSYSKRLWQSPLYVNNHNDSS